MGKNIINLTPHEIVVWLDEKGKDKLIFPPSGKVARVEVVSEQIGTLEGVPLVKQYPGRIIDLPPPAGGTGTYYIVSQMVLEALHHSRSDVVAPDTSPESVVRDGDGKIIAVRRFVRG